MSVLLDDESKVIVQGITGREGVFHSERMLEYGTNVVGGVTPGKADEEVHGKPVFDSVEGAVDETGADTSIIYVPPPFAADAVEEAAQTEAVVEAVEGGTGDARRGVLGEGTGDVDVHTGGCQAPAQKRSEW